MSYSPVVEAVFRQFDNVRTRLRGAELTAEEADTLATELHRLEEFIDSARRRAEPRGGRA